MHERFQVSADWVVSVSLYSVDFVLSIELRSLRVRFDEESNLRPKSSQKGEIV